MVSFDNTPPAWAMALLHVLVHREFREEIQGDLREIYTSDCEKYGPKTARRLFYRHLFSVLRPTLIFNFNRSIMTPRNWLFLALIALFVIMASIAPFLPGSGNTIAHGFSQFAQIFGYLGLVFVPVGLIWLIVEIRNKKDKQLTRWTNGYYLAWLALVPVLLFLPIQLYKTLTGDQPLDLWPFVIISALTAFIIYLILRLRNKTTYKFNPVPLYIVMIPFIAILTSKVAVDNAATISREKAILKTEPLIAAIERYKTEQGDYPDNLELLEGKYIQEIPKINVMNTMPYMYQKGPDSFELRFERYWHWSATEVVIYFSTGKYEIKGNYEHYPTEHKNWWFYLAD